MASARRREPSPETTPKPRRRVATTPEGRENQITALAYDLAEKQIKEGTASSQVISHFLKMGSQTERLAREKAEAENALLKAKIEQIESGARIEALYKEAIDAMRGYQRGPSEDDEYYE